MKLSDLADLVTLRNYMQTILNDSRSNKDAVKIAHSTSIQIDKKMMEELKDGILSKLADLEVAKLDAAQSYLDSRKQYREVKPEYLADYQEQVDQKREELEGKENKIIVPSESDLAEISGKKKPSFRRVKEE